VPKPMAKRIEPSIPSDVLAAFRVESRNRTLASGRIMAGIGIVAIALFWLQDVFIVGTRDFVPWRILGLLPLTVFLALSFGAFRKMPGLIVPMHAISLAAMMAMICGVAATVALHDDFDPADLHAAANGISVVVVTAFLFAAGARKFLGAIVLLPMAALAAALLSEGALTSREWSCFSNPAMMAAAIVSYAFWQERVRLRDFAVKARAEASDRMVRLQHNMMSTMLDAVEESAFLMRPDGEIAYANETVAARLGSDKHSIIGKNAYGMLPPEVAERRRDEVRHCLESGEPVRFSDERTDRRIDNVIYPVRGIENEIAYLAVFGLDITERVRAEEEVARLLAGKTLILKEVHHRIKNNMATIASLLAISAEASPEPGAATVLEEMRGRVLAMMAIYERLYRSEDYSSVGLRSYVQDLIAEIGNIYRTDDSVGITAEIDDLDAPPRISFAIGIIVNELIINALKYAFPDKRRGTVTVRVRGCDGGGIGMTVSDDGIGLDATRSPDKKEGFGHQLVRLMVEQCGGTLSMETDAGTVIRISLPALG